MAHATTALKPHPELELPKPRFQGTNGANGTAENRHPAHNIPFSPPFVDENVTAEVLDSLHSGWITTGPKVQALEGEFNRKYGFAASVGVNSWTSGAILVLKWLGLKPGDEVIIPSYTYSATALAVLHAGGTPVMVDVGEDFNIDVEQVAQAMTPRTKAVIGVDIGGYPADYEGLWRLVNSPGVRKMFVPEGVAQNMLGRPLLISDAAHSFGAVFGSRLGDVVIFSLHAVKNLTAAEGGIVSLNLPEPFDNGALYPVFRRLTLNGQSRDALDKSKAGGWRYDILHMGMKCNLPDVNAAIALGQLKSWDAIQHRRLEIHERYHRFFSDRQWAQLPPRVSDAGAQTSGHLFMLRVKGIEEAQRDAVIAQVSASGIAVNVHFIPMPLLSLFKGMGYDIANHPAAFDNYSREISLPIYPGLTDEQVDIICREVAEAVESITGL